MSERIGHYRLVRRLGQGATGEVWEAVLEGPRGFRKPVALKRLRRDPDDAHDREHLIREARLGALLQHPNVVGVHALEEHDGEWVVVMELVRGAPVSELIRARPLPPRALLELATQAGQGLAHIHGLVVDGRPVGLVHRDLKPSNLLVAPTGLLKIADLGVAALGGDRAVVGTPGYMPPEQWAGEVDVRSDLFALAVTLYACAMRRLPFPREITRDRDRLAEALRDPEVFAPVDAVVPGLSEVLQRCVAPDPDARPASAAELLAALGPLRREVPDGPGLRAALEEVRPATATPDAVTTWRSASQATVVRTVGNLVLSRDDFVGREHALADLVQQVRGGARLLTLLGPGGIGKTRLACQAAARVQPDLPGGAWFVDLSEARTTGGVCLAIARALGLQLDPEAEAVQQVGWALKARGEALLVLDNLEQCAAVVAELLDGWLELAAEARFLGTSRQRLAVVGEQGVPLGPLTPDEGVALFHARSPVPVPRAHHEAVRRVVAGVDGLPLAIELAASRTRLLPVPQLEERLGLALLAGGGHDRPARHRSLQASLAWSWELLGEHGRAALAQLAVLEGAFELQAAEATLELPDDAGWAMDVLAELADASLVQVHVDSGRFSLLQVVRAFAAEALSHREATEARHGAWFAQLGERSTVADLDDLIVGVRRAVTRGDGAAAAGCALGAWHLLSRSGPVPLARELVEAALDCVGSQAPAALHAARGMALLSLGQPEQAEAGISAALQECAPSDPGRPGLLLAYARIAFRLGGLDVAEARLAEALAWGLRAGDRRVEGAALADLGMVCIESGRLDEGQEALERARDVLREVGDALEEGRVHGYLGTLNIQAGRLDEAESALRRALVRVRRTNNHRFEAIVLGNLGILERQRGRIDEARGYLRSALALHRRAGSRAAEAMVHTNLGNLDLQQELGERARARYEAAVALAEDMADSRVLCIALANLGQVQHRLGELEPAQRSLERARQVAEARGDPRIHGHVLGELASVLGHRDPAAAHVLLVEAEALVRRAGDPGMLAGVHVSRARVLALAGDREGAEASLVLAEAAVPEGRTDLDTQIADVRSGLHGG